MGVAAEGADPTKISGGEPVTNSLGYVQQADGEVETVVADGESVRLIPETPASSSTAQVAPPADLPEAVSPTQGSAASVASVSSAAGRAADYSMHSGRLSDGAVIRQASYQVSTPAPSAADSAGPGPSSTVTSGGAVEADRLAKLPVVLKPLGFVVKADGQFAAILSQDDEIYIVRQGDLFAGRYRALSVSADAVEALEEPPSPAAPIPFAAPPAFPDSLSDSVRQAPSFLSSKDYLGCKSNEVGKVSGNVREGRLRGAAVQPVIDDSQATHGSGQADPATFIFQTLGYVQTQSGELRAIVSDGPETYLVKQGDTFADQYRATSVDPILVLAVKVSPGRDPGDFLFTRTESGDESASKNLRRYLRFPHSDGPGVRAGGSHSEKSLAALEIANGHTFHSVDISASPAFADLGADLFSSASAGFDLKSLFFMADNPKVGF